jgi:hypothetical protein
MMSSSQRLGEIGKVEDANRRAGAGRHSLDDVERISDP